MSNWYKNIIKFSSWNLKFPEELYKDIDEISSECEKYHLLGENERRYVGTVNFQNPYDKIGESIDAIIEII